MRGRALWQVRLVLMMGMIGAVTVIGFSGGTSSGGPRLISVQPFSVSSAETCEWPPANGYADPAAAAPQGESSPEPSETARRAASLRKPDRIIADPYPSFTSVAVDPVRNEVVLTDQSLFNIMVYDRLVTTAPTAAKTEPKRIIGGLRSKIEYQVGLYVDPANGDIYVANNDTHDSMVVFSRQQQGDIPPERLLYTPRGGFGIAVDEGAQELYLTGQHDSWVTVWKKTARENDSAVRLLQGDRTRLADPHGIALDTKARLMFVTNHGSFRPKHPGGAPSANRGGGRNTGKQNWPIMDPIPGGAQHLPPSITIYAMDAQGDTAPLRTIEGPNTQLNWPAGISFDPRRNELYVANDMGGSILVFSAAASGDVTPVRVLKGPKTGMKNPTGVAVDVQNDELWVANFGNHTATVYKSTAAGDTPPLRIIRSSPAGVSALMIGNPGGVAYDTKRDEILTPN